MKKLLRFLWTGTWHDHHWEVYQETIIVDDDDVRIGNKFTLQCKTCGEMKVFRTDNLF
jgi:hypothetical protein